MRLWDTKTWRVRTLGAEPIAAEREDDRPRVIDSLAIRLTARPWRSGLPSGGWICDAYTGRLRSWIKDTDTGPPKAFSFGDGGRCLACTTESGYESPWTLNLETGHEFDWSNKPFPSRTTAYWIAGLVLCLAAIVVARVKRRLRERHDAVCATLPKKGAKRRIMLAVIGLGIVAIPVAGVLVRRTIFARRLTEAIDARPEYDPAAKTLLKSFAEQAVVSPRCARLLEILRVQLNRDDRTKTYSFQGSPPKLELDAPEMYHVFRSRYTDDRGRVREVCVFNVPDSGLHTVVIMDKRGRVLNWKEKPENMDIHSAAPSALTSGSFSKVVIEGLRPSLNYRDDLLELLLL